MSPWLLFVLLSFATFRITRLIVNDTFPPIERARNWIQDRRGYVDRVRYTHVYDERMRKNKLQEYRQQEYWWLGELVGCVWCASAYVSGALTLITWAFVGLPLPLLWWTAVWGAGAYLASAKTS